MAAATADIFGSARGESKQEQKWICGDAKPILSASLGKRQILTLLFKRSGEVEETRQNKYEIGEENRPPNVHIGVLLLLVTL